MSRLAFSSAAYVLDRSVLLTNGVFSRFVSRMDRNVRNISFYSAVYVSQGVCFYLAYLLNMSCPNLLSEREPMAPEWWVSIDTDVERQMLGVRTAGNRCSPEPARVKDGLAQHNASSV